MNASFKTVVRVVPSGRIGRTCCVFDERRLFLTLCRFPCSPPPSLITQYLYDATVYKNESALRSAFDVANARLDDTPRREREEVRALTCIVCDQMCGATICISQNLCAGAAYHIKCITGTYAMFGQCQIPYHTRSSERHAHHVTN